MAPRNINNNIWSYLLRPPVISQEDYTINSMNTILYGPP